MKSAAERPVEWKPGCDSRSSEQHLHVRREEEAGRRAGDAGADDDAVGACGSSQSILMGRFCVSAKLCRRVACGHANRCAPGLRSRKILHHAARILRMRTIRCIKGRARDAAARRRAGRRLRTLDRETFGRRLRAARKRFGWTLAERPSARAISITTISRAERGQLALGYEKFSALGRALQHGHGRHVRRGRRRGQAVPGPVLTRAGQGVTYRGLAFSYEFLGTQASRQADEPDARHGARARHRGARRTMRGTRARSSSTCCPARRGVLRDRRGGEAGEGGLALLRQPRRPCLHQHEPAAGQDVGSLHQREQSDAAGERPAVITRPGACARIRPACPTRCPRCRHWPTSAAARPAR